MIARLALVAAFAASAAAEVVTINCGTAQADVSSGFSFLRAGNSFGAYVDYAVSCGAGTQAMIVGRPDNTINVDANTRVTIVNRAGQQFSSTQLGCSGAQVCSAQVTGPTTINIETSSMSHTIFDCTSVSGTVMGSIFMMGNSADASTMFSCSSTSTSAPSGINGAMSTMVGFFTIPNSIQTSTTYTLQLTSPTSLSVTAPDRIVGNFDTTVASATGCSSLLNQCTFVDGAASNQASFFITLNGMAANAPMNGNGNNQRCSYECESFSGQPATGCTSSSSSTLASVCQGQATAVVVTPCTNTNFVGQVVCVPKFTEGSLAQGNIETSLALFGRAPNPVASFFGLIGILRAQGFTFAVGTTCTSCVATALGSNGFLACGSCSLLTSTTGNAVVTRQGTGARIVICNGGAVDANNFACLEAAACAGALDNAACFRSGLAVNCPVCRLDDEIDTSSSSKKGLYGLLGLLLIIPAVLLLCSSIICCCLLLKKRKRPVPVPMVAPTFAPMAPMASVCEPVACGGTMGAPMGCSPYGAAPYGGAYM